MNVFIFSILIVFSTEAMIDVGLAGLSQMKVRVRYREKSGLVGLKIRAVLGRLVSSRDP